MLSKNKIPVNLAGHQVENKFVNKLVWLYLHTHSEYTLEHLTDYTVTLHHETNAENWIMAPIFIEYKQCVRMVLSLWNGITIHIFAGTVNSDCKMIPLGKPSSVSHRKVACYTLSWFLHTYVLCHFQTLFRRMAVVIIQRQMEAGVTWLQLLNVLFWMVRKIHALLWETWDQVISSHLLTKLPPCMYSSTCLGCCGGRWQEEPRELCSC